MNDKDTSTVWVLAILGAGMFALLVAMLFSNVWKIYRSGKVMSSNQAFIYVAMFAAFFLGALFLTNYYRAQMTSVADARGIHWKTLFASKSIAWGDVKALSFHPLKNGQSLRIQGSTQAFQQELPLLKHPDEFVRFVENASHRKALVGSNLSWPSH